MNSGSIWDDSSLSSLDFSPQRQALSESVSSMRSSRGGMETRPGMSNAEARDVGLTTPRRTNWTQDEEESKGSLFEETEEESSPCIPGGARKSPSLEVDDPAIVTDTDGGPNAERTTTGSEETSSSDELRKEFLSVLRSIEGCEERDLSGRVKPSCKGILVLQRLLRAVDDLIVLYHEGSQSLWRLDCLVYAGIQQGKANTCKYYKEATKLETEGGRCGTTS